MTNKAEVENKIQLPLTDGGEFSPRFIELVFRKAQLPGETQMRPPALALPLLLSALTQSLDNVWQFPVKDARLHAHSISKLTQPDIRLSFHNSVNCTPQLFFVPFLFV
ncbi:hypothetical protein [Paraburkholderia sp. BR10954]|uniref:hypothetical protein n=1 Tax=Paraburkholderia sp. BR10954 TaxID=3236995 RepID=UPI0034D15410